MKIFKVTVVSGSSHGHFGVYAETEAEAVAKVRAEGFPISSASVYEINEYGLKFCCTVVE